MSKFNRLLQALPCEWVCPVSGDLCDEAFENMEDFLSHIRQRHLPATPDHALLLDHAHQAASVQVPHDTMGACQWCDCEFKTVSSTAKEFKVHTLFHAYHSYLKLLGKEYQARHDLPVCRVDPDLANTLPLIEVDLRCQWDDGSCGAEFDCVSSLYDHVHRHAHDGSGDSVCRWQGKVDV